MSELSGPTIAPGDLAEVHTQSAIDFGTRIFDDAGNEYIFLKGIASTLAGSWATYDEEHLTTLLAANAKGPVAIAQAATNTNAKYGWYLIWGTTTALAQAGVADNEVTIGRSVTDGYVGSGATAGDIIYGVIARSSLTADTGTGKINVQIYYPWVDDATGSH